MGYYVSKRQRRNSSNRALNMQQPNIKITHIHGLFARMMSFENVGDTELGHTHQFDHATLVAHGAVLVRCRGKETVFKAPQLIWIAADLKHELVAQEAGTVCVCLHTTESSKLGDDIVSPDMIPAGAEESFARSNSGETA
jgi:quercetin dioxygenase-like cupin family protein